MPKKKYTTKQKIKLAKKRGVYTEYELNILIPAFLTNNIFDEINKEKQTLNIGHIGAAQILDVFISLKRTSAHLLMTHMKRPLVRSTKISLLKI